MCSHCFSTRKLHQSDGMVHSHGSRIKPCVGSHQPPLTSTQARAQSVAVDGASAPGDGGGGPVSMAPSEPHSRSHTDFQSGDEEVSRHPRQIGGRVMKHVPKGARFACARSLTDILQSINSNPSGTEQWRQLLWFASNILTQPERAGRRRNLANLVKRRIENHEMLRTKDEEEREEGGSGRRPSAKDRRLAAVGAKLEEGNIRAATRILCSQDCPVIATQESLAAMQERHPKDNWAANLADLPVAAQTAPFQVTEREVLDAMRSFPAGSSGGPDGMRPQLLLDLLNNRESSETLLQALTGFINVLLRGECPPEIREIMFGGTLIALSKKSGGLRPIAIGYIWRRLAAKCANKFAVTKLESFFAPLQMGIATAGGCEAAVHAARSFITGMPRDQVFVKLDFANAFNTLRRDVMLQAVYNTIPELYAFIHQAYSAESLLQFGPFVVHSQLGPQQGDPLGPLLFCLPLHSTLQSMRSRLRLGYLDDISLGGKVEDVQHDLAKVKELELSLGIRLNRNKCEYYSDVELLHKEFDGFQRIDCNSLFLLGAPLFKGDALNEVLIGHCDSLKSAVEDLACLQSQAALMLLRSCFGAPKLMYILRTAQCWGHSLLEEFDNQMRAGLEMILNIRLSDIQWKQATLPIRDGGLGFRRVSMLASSAYIASAASTRSLVSAVLDTVEWSDVHLDEILESRSSTKPTGDEQLLTSQKVWDRPLIAIERAAVWSSNNDPLNQARLGAVSSPHSGDWLLTIPVASCGLGLSNEAVRVAVGLRLGLELCAPHQCHCGETADSGGHHGLVCKRSTGRAARHFAVNDIIWRALVKADVPSSKEPPGLIRNDGKRPDGATLVPWARGKYIAWDATTVHTCAASYIHLTSVAPGGAAEHAADRKRGKYSNLPATHDFVPVAIESLGPVNRTGREFLMELGRRMTTISCDPRETAHLFQRLSICSQRFNAIAFRGTFPQSSVSLDL